MTANLAPSAWLEAWCTSDQLQFLASGVDSSRREANIYRKVHGAPISVCTDCSPLPEHENDIASPPGSQDYLPALYAHPLPFSLAVMLRKRPRPVHFALLRLELGPVNRALFPAMAVSAPIIRDVPLDAVSARLISSGERAKLFTACVRYSFHKMRGGHSLYISLMCRILAILRTGQRGSLLPALQLHKEHLHLLDESTVSRNDRSRHAVSAQAMPLTTASLSRTLPDPAIMKMGPFGSREALRRWSATARSVLRR
ncbi:hypothetical protein B0J12DRAFT_379304 [Macrophomina phaseolina]|uniref:Uncharacterized protein n=1 Tax=Macrophomina phaseolina TaxID=35725 RepID=A0ABQ8GKM3_9PEZI|nr:hypothetical protein B0J12DRAFT_379304 [Macrophomina phaseolina]